MADSTTIRIALAGNPNSGKTSLFNALTGSNQHVGNYTGVTVEKRKGSFSQDGRIVDVIDLPGTYNLTSYSPEERIAQQELLHSDLDVVVAVVDATALKRHMVLVTQLMQVGVPMVLCLNMSDEADRAGQRLEIDVMSDLLGMPVVLTVGHKGTGVDQLRREVIEAADTPPGPYKLVLGQRLDRAIDRIQRALQDDGQRHRGGRWVAAKLLTDDRQHRDDQRTRGQGGQRIVDLARRQRERIEAETGHDIALYATECAYGFVDGLIKQVTVSESRPDARAASDQIDRVLAHRVLGLPVFGAVMYGVFWVTFTLGEIPMGWIEAGFAALGHGIGGLWPAGSDSALRSLLVDGVIGGVGGVLVFLPNIVLLFLCLAFLEDTGYMARAAFLMDHVMHRFGLHGRSFIPLMTGFGCSIPGIMATRTLEHEHDRLATMMVLPLMSCGARLSIWMLLIPAFFPPAWRAPALWGIYATGVLLALALALLLRRTVLRGDEAQFVMELPPYRIPTGRSVVTRMIERSWLYLRKAGTVILAISVLMWVATSYPKLEPRHGSSSETHTATVQRSADEQASAALRHSVAGRVGTAMEPLLRPLGFDWRIGIAMVGAFAAKEVFVAQMGIIYAMGETDENSHTLRAALARDYSLAAGLALMVFLLIGTPCMATLAVTRRESGSWKWALVQMVGLTTVAYLAALVVFQVGRLILS